MVVVVVVVLAAVAVCVCVCVCVYVYEREKDRCLSPDKKMYDFGSYYAAKCFISKIVWATLK